MAQVAERKGLLLALGFVALLAGGYGVYRVVASEPQHTFAGTVIEQPRVVDTFELARAGGEAVRFPEAWRGKVLLVFFGYANCPDVCPLTMSELAKIYRDLDEPEDLQVVMVTVDPSRDTPERLKQYVESFHPSFVGLSGDATAIAKAGAAFYVNSVPQGDGLVAHNSHVTLVDRQGRLRVVYTQDNVPKMTEDLRYVLAQERW